MPKVGSQKSRSYAYLASLRKLGGILLKLRLIGGDPGNILFELYFVIGEPDDTFLEIVVLGGELGDTFLELRVLGGKLLSLGIRLQASFQPNDLTVLELRDLTIELRDLIVLALDLILQGNLAHRGVHF